MIRKRFFWCALASLLVIANLGPFSAAAVGTNKTGVLLVTGIDYPGHLWRQTAPALAEALRKDSRLDVYTVEDPNCLDSATLTNYRAILLHFQNWQTSGPGVTARENLLRFVKKGGGLVSVHFACGAWHDEWPEFRKIVGRVWDPALRPHDPYGKFRVKISDPNHPITKRVAEFETTDELYTCLVGEEPIHILLTANSVVDQKEYPMAFIKDYGEGRVFLTTLGHDLKAITNPAVTEMMRRACAWSAGLPAVAP
jgi:type 1 glutamine amidotransferase